MNEVNTKRLVKEFPNLYADHGSDRRDSRMADGFRCGDGWFDLVYKLSQQLEKIIVEYKKNNKEDPKPPRAVQVKEKYGALCFYMSHFTSDEMRDVISEAEAKSHKTCENCGRPGVLRNDKYCLVTLCEHHHKNR